MALFSITQTAYGNLPPSSIGDIDFDVAHGSTKVFTKNDFGRSTLPPYTDPEGDDISKVKIITIPTTGVLALSAVPVIANDEIDVADIDAGNLIYTPDVPTTTLYVDTLTFDVSDVGSNAFSGLTPGITTLNVAALANAGPTTVGDRTENINYGESLIFTTAMFTTLTTPPYADPEGDPAFTLKITGLPLEGVIKFDGINVVVNQEILFSDIVLNKLVYTGILSKFTSTSTSFTFEVADSGSGIFKG